MAPPSPMSNHGSQTASLQGLERTMRSPPTPRQTPRPSVSSRKASSASINKPLPPEPPPPLFSITPSPKSSPRPQPSSRGRVDRSPETRRSQSSGHGGRHEPEKLLTDPCQEHRVSLQSLSPFGGRHKNPDRTGSNGSAGPLSAASETPTSIIDSYSSRSAVDPVPRNGTPLIAPHAQSLRVLSTQQERLHNFETFDPNALFTSSEQMLAAVAEDIPEGNMQRKDTLAYRFDTPKESDQPIIFNQPLWAINDDSMSAEDIALRYRNTLPPSPFSSVSEYEDDEVTSTPTIPVLPPLPANSPFRLPSPVENSNTRPTSRSPHLRKRSTQQQVLVLHSPAISRENSYGRASKQIIGGSSDNPETRPFGSQASWEPGDDAVKLHGTSVASENHIRPRPSLLSRYAKDRHYDTAEFPRLPSDQQSSAVPGTPPPVLGASINRPMSGPSFPNGLASVSPAVTPRRHESERDLEKHVSYWSDDSDDGSKKLRVIGAKLRKIRAGKAHSATSTGSRVSSTNTRTISSVETSEPQQNRAAAVRKDRSSLTYTEKSSANGTHDTLAQFSVDTEEGSVKSKTIEEQYHRHDGHRSLPPVESRPFSPSSPVSPQFLSDFKSRLTLKSRTWGVNSSGIQGDAEPASAKPLKSDLGWLARLRKSNREEMQSEKRREDMKRKIKIVQSEPQGTMAIVATQEMRERIAAANDAGTLKHF